VAIILAIKLDSFISFIAADATNGIVIGESGFGIRDLSEHEKAPIFDARLFGYAR
jgi:hypothetical protein